MKKLIIIATAISMLASCATPVFTPRQVYRGFLDYAPYTENGFLISPDPYTGEFESLGEIILEVIPGEKLERVQYESAIGATYHNIYTQEPISTDELIAMAVSEAKAKGADALVNFSFQRTFHKTVLYKGMEYEMHKYVISGFCIKRK